MAVKNQTTTNFDAASMARYGQAQDTALSGWQALSGNPLTSNAFKAQMELMNRNAQNQRSTGMFNMLNNMSQFSTRGQNMPLYMASQMGKADRASQGLQQNALWSAIQAGQQQQNTALNALQGFHPLETGSTQTTSGTGTWLTPILGAAVGGVTSALTGGLMGNMPKMGGSAAPGLPLASTRTFGNGFLNPGMSTSSIKF